MTVTATPTTAEPTHHISLVADGTTIGLIAVNERGIANPRAISKDPIERINLKTSSGDMQYSDYSWPYVTIAQDDWSGGRGQDDWEDPSRYNHAYMIDTSHSKKMFLGPQMTFATGHRKQNLNMPGDVTWQGLHGANQYLAYKFDSGAGYDADKAYFHVRKTGTPNGVITVELCSDSPGDPSTVLKTATIAEASIYSFVSQFYVFDWATTQTLAASTNYWIKIYGHDDDDATNHYEVAVNSASGATEKSTDNSTWAAAAVDLFYRVVDADDDMTARFYRYKGGLYCVTWDDDHSAARIFYNGDRGTADANGSGKTTLIDASKSAVWTASEWIGCVVEITGGTGHTDKTNYRTITANTTTTLTVDPAWDTTHDTTTEYVIKASNKWTEMTGHGLAVPVTDVLVAKDVVYYAQGDGVAMRRHREYTSSGTWTATDWSADGTNKATYLALESDAVDGLQVWRAQNIDTNSEASVSRATAQAWGTDLTFGTEIPVGDRSERITGIAIYGEPASPHILKEGSLWTIEGDAASKMPLDEMDAVRSNLNGATHLVHNVYLYFSLLHGWERYYRSNLDDVGPNKDAGLQAGYQGPITHAVGYPGKYFCSVDAGTGNSSVLVNNGYGWHVHWRAPEAEQSIRRLHIQVIPGSTVDRMWISMGPDILWLPLPSNTLDPTKDTSYTYSHDGIWQSSWHYLGMKDIDKFFNSIKLFTESLAEGAQTIEASYVRDDSSTWTDISSAFDTSPVEEQSISVAGTPKTGKRIKIRLRFDTNDNAKTPIVKAVVLEAVAIVKPKYSYSLMFQARDEALDLQGDEDTVTSVATLLDQLNTWASAATPVTMRCILEPYDNKTVFVQPYGAKPIWVIPDESLEVQTGTVTLLEA